VEEDRILRNDRNSLAQAYDYWQDQPGNYPIRNQRTLRLI
jgi:hypothetical protein